MSCTSPEADTTAWRDLLSWMADDELRQLLDERGAWMLAEIHSDPMRILEGKPLPSRSWRCCARLLPG